MANLKTLVSFDIADGARPQGSLAIDAAGDLFGTAPDGGANSAGTIFEVAKVGDTYASTPTTLVSLTGVIDEGPASGVILDATGNLVGTSEFDGANGVGDVFEVQKTAGGFASTPVTLADFNETNGGGRGPAAGLTADSAGNLFGTTSGGGTKQDGTVFEIPKTASGYGALTTLVSFGISVSDGQGPEAGLITDAAGDLFGTTLMGGLGSSGTVFEIVKDGGTYSSTPMTLATFSGSNGAFPSSGLVADAAGDLFGTTSSGPNGAQGTVFEIPKTTEGYGELTTLVTFDLTDGEGPNGGLIIDAAGNLFGTTELGGASLDGTVFEVPKVSGTYASTPTTLVNFKPDDPDGARPFGGLVADAEGNLFGTTSEGGTGGVGTVFELTDTGYQICFLAGTRIATPRGEVAVERLAAGDMVITLCGAARHIVWIGSGRVLATRGQRNAATPVIVRKGALADNVPHHDLRVSQGHSLYIDGALIPVEFLVNHRSIIWDDHAQEVALYHIELETHDVLLADGAPAESYRDDGNRWLFQNANTGWGLPSKEPCAPVLTGGPIVDAAWRRLLERAGPCPWLPTTEDADLHLLVDGRRVDAATRHAMLATFRLAARPTTVRIVSRAAAPAELGLARDPRSLGVALRQISAWQGRRIRIIEAADTSLADGFHGYEVDNDIRWTNGDAAVPQCLFDGFMGPLEIMLRLGGQTRYTDEDTHRQAA